MITVNCQSSIKIADNGVTVYFDPLNIDEQHDADVIFITHAHWDHFSPDDIAKVKQDDTIAVAPADVAKQLPELGFAPDKIMSVTPGQQLEVAGLPVQAVPAYNIHKDFHPQANNWVGYVVIINGTTYYAMGDTDALPENESIACDTLFVPIGGTYTMNAAEAAKFTNKLNPEIVIPIHYGLVVGTADDLNKFTDMVNNQITIETAIAL